MLCDDPNGLHKRAEDFDTACDGDQDQKDIYRHHLLKYLEFSYYGEGTIVPIEEIWDSIMDDNTIRFRLCMENEKNKWLNLNIRKQPFTEAFKKPAKDIKVKNLFLKRWKPAHL